MSARQVRFQKAYNSARLALNLNQRCRNAFYNRNVYGPTYQVSRKGLLHNPVGPFGKWPKFSSPWKGPFVIIQCLFYVTCRIQEIATQKNSLFNLTDSSCSMNPHWTGMYQRAIKEIRKTYLHQNLYNKNHQFQSTRVRPQTVHMALSVPSRPFSNHLCSRRCLHNPDCYAHISNYTNWSPQICTTKSLLFLFRSYGTL